MKKHTRASLVIVGLTFAAAALGGCSNYSRPITFTSQPTSLIACDKLGGVMYDDHVALAQASRVARARDIIVTTAQEPR